MTVSPHELEQMEDTELRYLLKQIIGEEADMGFHLFGGRGFRRGGGMRLFGNAWIAGGKRERGQKAGGGNDFHEKTPALSDR